MAFLIIVTVILVILICYFVFKERNVSKNVPVGTRKASLEKGWPFLGILPNVKEPICHYLMRLGKKHGPLFRIRFGMRDVFVLNNHDIMRKCLKEDGDNFSGRWKGKVVEIAVKNSGIILIDGEVWALHRSFMLKVLRDFGFGKSKTTEIVQEECEYLLRELDSKVNTEVNFSELIPVYTANIISKFIMNKRFQRTDSDFVFITTVVEEITKKPSPIPTFLYLFPFFDNSTFLSKFSLLFSNIARKFETIYGIFRREIENHKKNLDSSSEGDDFMDRFLMEQARIQEKTGSHQSYTEFQLIRSSFELFIAGFETTSTTLGWSLLFLSRYEEEQRRMHDEIVSLLGPEQMPGINDRKSLPLTQAIIDEITRLSSVSALASPHRTFRDTVIDGIFIPKDSFVFPNLYACHRDPKVWKKPFEFYPEHFLTTSSEATVKYCPKEELIVFGMGKRQCLGESLARAETFIFLTSIIQRYKIKFAKNISEDEYQEALLANDGIIRFSKIKDFIFEKYD